jgi:hypothetical protein
MLSGEKDDSYSFQCRRGTLTNLYHLNCEPQLYILDTADKFPRAVRQ